VVGIPASYSGDKIYGSNLGPQTGHLTEILVMVSSQPRQEQDLKLGYDRFLPRQIQFIIHFIRPGHAVAQLVEALRYKPEGRGFASR
jgi:hypothetical protein